MKIWRNNMSKMEIVNNVEIEVVSSDDTFLISNKDVATAFGVGVGAIKMHKSRSEFTEGKHWVSQVVTTLGGKQTQVMWTKRGIIRLGFKLQETEFTIAFRDWAEDYIISGGEVQQKLTPAQEMAKGLMIAQHVIAEMEDKNNALRGANNLLINKNEALTYEAIAAKEEIQERDKVVEYLSDRSKDIKIGEWAKLMFDLEGINIGSIRLFKVLRAMGYLMAYSNQPKQAYMNQRLFVTKQNSYPNKNGETVYAEPTPLVTQKGIDKLTPIIRDYILSQQ